MAKYVFLEMPAYGHVNPTLAVAQELVKRGQEVIYYLPEQFKGAVEATGAVFRSYGSKLKGISPMATPSGMLGGGLPALMVDESRHVLPQVLDRIRAEQPDYIVYGAMCVWARIVTQVLNVSAITLRPTYVMNEHIFSMMAQQRNQDFSNMREVIAKISTGLADLCEIYHVPPFDLRSIFTHDGQLIIVFIPKAFQPMGETFDERYLFVGPSILPRHEDSDFPLDKLSNEQPILYISLGTVFNNQPEFFKMCFEAFGEQPWQVVLSRGKHVDPAALGPVPDNFLVSPYVPQLEILSRTQVFVTHGGMNSTMESLYYGVPMVAIPQMLEQAMTARRITEMGLGIALEKEAVNVTMLREAVERVANGSTFRERVQNMQQIAREAGGYLRAAEAIIQFAEEHAKV
ncbi:MAG TPA: macrolide family glycosyltransferase [Ktedonobacteraceae bacterium]|nr:macrolide family glycosyltransferase [Ktedonobacteraceae bacterium]